MATYPTLKSGSSGSDVKKLQQSLVDAGYDVGSAGVDGIFGSATEAALKKYQQDNGLTADGIAGENTLGKLYGGTTTTGGGVVNTPSPTTTMPAFEYGEYKASDTVAQAEALLQQQLSQKPGAYQSAWQTQLDDAMQKILNREKFSYDLNGDALYQQYKDQYTTQGKMAMMDTMGQAAAMTGGYGNSYAQTVGQQTYQGYLQQLNDVVPELYQLALNQYNQEGADLYNQYSMFADRENLDYGRYRDNVSDYYADLDRLYNQYNTERDYDYSKWADGRDFSYGQYSDDRAYEYQAGRDAVADQQWQAEFDEAKRQYDQQYELSLSKLSSSGGSSSSGGFSSGNTGSNDNTSTGYDNGGLSASKIRALQQALGVAADGKYGPKTQAAAGGLSAEEAYNKYVLNDEVAGKKPTTTSGFTGTTYEEAVAYLNKAGVPNNYASNIMTKREFQRHSVYSKEFDSYQAYLADIVAGMMAAL